MNPVLVVCPNCRATLRLKGAVPEGKTPRCPKCNSVVPLNEPSSIQFNLDPPGRDTQTGEGSPTEPKDSVKFTGNSAKDLGAASYPFFSPPRQADEIGRLGKYRILGELGAGGMGMVFRAEDPMLRRQVALKVMLPQYAANDSAKQRFLREARAAAQVEHDHVIPIFQVDEDNGAPYLAMPLLKGETLATALRQNMRVPWPEVVRVGREMAEGLAAAHEKHLIHRDIKPGNVWLEGERRRVKILDFGLARPEAGFDEDPASVTTGFSQVASDPSDLTRTGTVVGTPAYMSPEQARGNKVDARTDLFSLGVVLYQMATGQLPFQGPTTMAMLTSLAVDDPLPPSQLAPEMPPALNDLLLQLLAKSPDHRPPSAATVANMLRHIEGTAATLPPASFALDDNNPWTQIAESFAESAPPPVMKMPALVERLKLTGKAKSGMTASQWKLLAGLAAGAVASITLIVVLLALLLRTPQGTLIVESDDPEAEITIKREGKVVIPRTKERSIALDVGRYSVDLAERKEELRLSKSEVDIVRKGEERLRIERRPALAKPTTKHVDPGIKPTPSPVDVASDGPVPPSGPLPPYTRAEEPLPAWTFPTGAPKPVVQSAAPAEAKLLQEAWAKFAKKPVEAESSVGMKFRLIPPGEFDFYLLNPGNPVPEAESLKLRVRLTRPYYLGETEVTIGQFEEFVKATNYKTEAETNGEGGYVLMDDNTVKADPKANWRKPWKYDYVDPKHPVVQISWNDAMAFCAWLSKKDKAHYRLATEAEWAYAARAGSAKKHVWGDDPADLLGNEFSKDNVVAAARTAYFRVDQGSPNAFGLFNMLGNVKEWTLDSITFDEFRYLDPNNPVGSGPSGAHRGGYIAVTGASLTPELRDQLDRNRYGFATGFRVVREDPAEKLVVPPQRPMVLRPGLPLGPWAAVMQPEKIPGLRSWSVEPASTVNCVAIAWASTGDRIATASNDHLVRIWDAKGNVIKFLFGHEGAVSSVAFSPDGTKLASIGETLRLWDVASGACLMILPVGAPFTGSRVAFSPDGKRLGYVGQNVLGIYDFDSGRLQTVTLPTQQNFFDWSPDSTQIVVAGVGVNGIGIWQTSPLKKLHDVKIKDKDQLIDPTALWAVGWSPDGKWLASAHSDPLVIRIWDAGTRELKRTIQSGGPNAVPQLVWNKDSRRLASTTTGVWDTVEAKLLYPMNVPAFAWSPTGEEYVSGGTLQFFDAITGQFLHQPKDRGRRLPVSLTYSRDGKHLIEFSRDVGQLWDLEAAKFLRELPAVPKDRSVAWPNKGNWLAVYGDAAANIAFVDFRTGRRVGELKDSTGATRVEWSPNDQFIASAHADGSIRIWTVASGTATAPLTGHTGPVTGLAWSPESSMLASSGSQEVSVRLWDAKGGKLAKAIVDFPKTLTFTAALSQPFAWSGDGKTLWLAGNTDIAPYDLATGKFGPLERFDGNAILSLAAAADGKLLAQLNVSGGYVRANAKPGRIQLGVNTVGGSSPQWLPDNRVILSNYGDGVSAFDTFTRRRLGFLWPAMTGNTWLIIGPTGHYNGPPGIEAQLVYVAVHDDGSQHTYTPAEFAQKFGWKNDPAKATITKLP